MKYRYIQIFSFLVALLSFSIFSACEVDDKIVFVQDKVNPPSQSEEMSFSVSESKQVCFSKGNLQYHPANNEWRFAESQLDYIGDANINISATYNGWLDLFGWSTSATNFGVSTSTNDNDYSGDFVDWGTNQIGSDAPNTWRTLSNDEWDYLLNTRTNADALRGVAQVNGVNGLVFLPDSWTCPEGVTFKSGFSSKWSVTEYGQYQTFTAEQWSLLESAGAIFLPASGRRYGSDVRYVQGHGNYWSATENNSFGAYYLYFVSDEAFMYFNCYDGLSVRLVKDLLPVVTTSTITQITETSAVAGGNVTSDGGAEVMERGVCVATASNPTTSNTKITSGSGTGSFTCELTNLQPNTTYYVRAYAINSMGTAYGEEVSFTTKEESNTPSNGTENYEYVDLGLSVKWATCNVGANSPEEYGDYFAWGEVEPKETYNFSTYKWCNGSYDTLTKYNTNSSFGTVDNKTTLDLSDDAARANWGGSWRMPTTAEQDELRENCTWTWTTQNGVYGYKVTSKSNGNSIFLPAAGFLDSVLYSAGSDGCYWSSSLYMYDDPDRAWYVSFFSGEVSKNSSIRYCGLSVRPVLGESEEEVTDPTVTTSTITQITETTAVAGGNVTSDGNASVTERGVCISTVSNPTTSNTKITAGSGTGSFTCNLTGLQPNTTYYVRAYAINSKGTAYGTQVTFTTSKSVVLPTVTTSTVTQIMQTTAVAGGTVTSDGNAGVTERGVVYSLSANPAITDLSSTIVRSGSGTGTFTCNLSNLQAGTTYYVRAYAINSKGTAYGDEISFTTALPITLATVTTASIAQITETTAVAGGNVTSDGNASVTERGVCISTVSNPTTSNTKITAGSGTGSFTCNLTGLQANTTYYVRAYAINSKGTAYGDEISFTTALPITIATVTTASITQITETSAVAGGNVTSDGNASVTERGVVYSTNPNPVITNLYNTIKPCGSGTGSFTCDLTNLQSNTTYYVRAYATNEMGTAYGEEISFTTVSLNGHEYVDLGLSVKWATCNVGASSPEKYGDFFAWGETEPKEQYYWSTYKHYNDSSSTLTKYNLFGTVADNKTQLELSDDAARANWGGSWRMPTYAELTELREQCTWTWTTQNGVKGYKVTSKSNGNSIFLPAAGGRDGSSLGYPGNFGNYWLSSLVSYTDNSNKAFYLYFNSGYVGCGSESRYVGLSVRPVWQ